MLLLSAKNEEVSVSLPIKFCAVIKLHKMGNDIDKMLVGQLRSYIT